jgi:hypothetical protein
LVGLVNVALLLITSKVEPTLELSSEIYNTTFAQKVITREDK